MARQRHVALPAVRFDESERNVPRAPHLGAVIGGDVQRADGARGHRDRPPPHHVGAAAPGRPVERRGVLPRLLSHQAGHGTGDFHGRLVAHLDDQPVGRRYAGREGGVQDLHHARMTGVLPQKTHLEPVERRVPRPRGRDHRQAQLARFGTAAVRCIERSPLAEFRVSDALADSLQVGRGPGREHGSGERAPGGLLRWNHPKRSLRDLAAGGGVATVPTRWLARGDEVDLPTLLADAGWREAVVKPAVSASAFGTWRTSTASASGDQARLDQMLSAGDVMVQPLLPEVSDAGEWSLLFLGRRFSHAVLKRPAPGDYRVQWEFGGSAVSAAPADHLIADAARVIAAVPGDPLYARVDGRG